MADTLRVWLEGEHVADLERTPAGSLRLRHTSLALERWPQNSPVVSCSLPLGTRAAEADAFFRGLLPEGAALDALATRADLPASDTFGLLARYGRDIAGALVLAEGEPAEDRYDVEPYDDEALAQEVGELESRPLGVHDDSELSIAGLQNKMLLVRLPGGGWGRPLHGHPSTHILKLDTGGRPGLVAAEAACLDLAHAIELPAATAELIEAGVQQCIVVERFDRAQDEDSVARIHQEDLAQATGRTAKYESRGRGGPGWRDAARTIERYARDPAEQLERLLQIATYTLAIGNADAHGKNLAFLHDTPTSVTLAPLYDTVPTVMWSGLRTEAAMGLDGRSSLTTCDRLDLVAEAAAWPLPRRIAERVVLDTLERLDAVLAAGDVLPKRGKLARTLRARVRNLLAGSPAGTAVATLGR